MDGPGKGVQVQENKTTLTVLGLGNGLYAHTGAHINGRHVQALMYKCTHTHTHSHTVRILMYRYV